jgi:hypothetical protein
VRQGREVQRFIVALQVEQTRTVDLRILRDLDVAGPE